VGLAVDQEQVKEDLLSGTMIGQLFTPRAPLLARLDIIIKNRTDPTPGRIRLWAWRGNYQETIKGRPLWEDDLDFSGQDAPVLRHYFPRVATKPGQKYLIECSRPSEGFYMAGVREDAYPDGFAVTNGTPRPDWDMWFRTFGPSGAVQTAPLPHRPLPTPPAVQPRPPRPPQKVTKQVYLDAVRTYTERNVPGWSTEVGRRIHDLMFFTGFLYKFGGQTQWAQRISGWLKEAEPYILNTEGAGDSPWFVSKLGFGIKWYRGNPLWTEQDEASARRIMLTVTRRMWQHPERGAMNRAMWDVLVFTLCAELYPDAPEAAQWRNFAQTVWHDWADYDDTNEDSSHYNAVFNHFMLAYVRLTDKYDIFKRPGMRQFVDRYRDVLAPNGMMVGWGDSLMFGADWGAWIALFETAASVTGDGTYKWAAHQVLDSHRRYILEEEPLQKFYEDMPNLVWAYLAADDSIEPVQPEPFSGVHTMAYPRKNPVQLRREKGLPYLSLEHREVPWKLVMRDSMTESAYYALFGLLPHGGHGHADAPALLALWANGTLLLHDTAYMDRRWEDHNLLFGVRLSGGKLGKEPSETEVKAFADGKAASYADIAWKDYPGWGLEFRRQILFVKGLGWWVRDRTAAGEESEWYLGPMWHVDRIRGRGETWFEVDYPAPSSFAWPIANGTDRLLIYFTPKEGATVDYADMRRRVREGRPWYSSAPWAVYQCEGPIKVGPGRQAAYDTLLLPLSAQTRARTAASRIGVVADEPAVRAITLERGLQTWTMGLINDGKEHKIGPVTTDALALVVRETPDKELVIQAFGATTVSVNGRRLMESEKPRDFAVGW